MRHWRHLTLGLPVILTIGGCGGGGGGTRNDASGDVSRDVMPEDYPSVDVGNDIVPDGLSLPDAWHPGCAATPDATVVAYASMPELTLSGDLGSPGGVFDPSVVYPTGATAGVMSYSSVTSARSIRTRIAVSTDHGATWLTVKDVNSPQDTSIDSTDCPAGICSGTLVNEVSSLIFDADDPDTARRWKLFTHRYLVLAAGDTLRYDLGHIAMATADKPDGTWTAPAPLIGWPSASSYSSKDVTLDVKNVPELASCVALSEPAAIWLPGVLDLALTCVRLVAGGPEISIVLLRSMDHAITFRYVSTLVTAAEATCFTGGVRRISAPDLFVADGKEYLLASPETAAGYRGCLVFPVEDPVAGVLRRDTFGNPEPSRIITVSPDRFNGACTYAEGAAGMGYALSIAFLESATRQFRIFPTHLLAP